MYNTTTSITLLITLLFTSASAGCLRANQLVSQLGISWYPSWASAGCSLERMSCIQNTQLQTFKLTCNLVVYM